MNTDIFARKEVVKRDVRKSSEDGLWSVPLVYVIGTNNQMVKTVQEKLHFVGSLLRKSLLVLVVLVDDCSGMEAVNGERHKK
jgi:hypothetical protein